MIVRSFSSGFILFVTANRFSIVLCYPCTLARWIPDYRAMTV